MSWFDFALPEVWSGFGIDDVRRDSALIAVVLDKPRRESPANLWKVTSALLGGACCGRLHPSFIRLMDTIFKRAT